MTKTNVTGEQVREAMSDLADQLAGHHDWASMGMGQDSETGQLCVRVGLTKDDATDDLPPEVNGVRVHYHVVGKAVAQDDITPQEVYKAWDELKAQLAGNRQIAGVTRSGPSQEPLLTVELRYGQPPELPSEVNGVPVKVEAATEVRDPGN